MYFLAMSDTFDLLDTLAVVMLAISFLAMLASLRISKLTDRLAAENCLNRQLKQDRLAKLRQRHPLLYQSMNERRHRMYPRT